MVWRTVTGHVCTRMFMILLTLSSINGYYYKGKYYSNGRSYDREDPEMKKLRRPAQKVGCDGVVGSGKTLDKCGVCAGNGDSCRVVSGIFVRQKLPLGRYNPITKIPKGACNINVTEKGYSRNFLAVRTSSGKAIISGNRSISRPGNYYSSGTTFKYTRNYPKGESILAKGPITEGIDLFLLYRQSYKGVYYEYTIPVKPQPVDPPSYVPDNKQTAGSSRAALQTGSNTQSGSFPLVNRGTQPLYIADRQALTSGSAGAYTPNLGGAGNGKPSGGSYVAPSYNQQTYRGYNRQQPSGNGYQGYRRYGNGRLSPPTYNQNLGRPTYNQQPQRLSDRQALTQGGRVNDGRVLSQNGRQSNRGSSADFIWKISGFTECDRKCGGGQQKTKIICVNSQTRILVTDENCAKNTKPKQQTVSCNTDPCEPDWETSDWSTCSKTCGRGVQTRSVECKQRVSTLLNLRVSADLCKDKTRPTTSHSCHLADCHKWRVGEWGTCSVECGRGQRTRDVACVDKRGNKVTNEKCKNQPEQPRSREACNEGPCQKTWFYTRWSEQCSADCGEGKFTRKVYCQGERAGPSACDAASKPESDKPCSSKKSCGGQWFAGEWSECKGTCTDGYQTRKVVCMKKHGIWYAMVRDASCVADTRPVERQSCEQLDCDTEWYMSDWGQCSTTCGEGYRAREVKCLDKKQKLSDNCKQATKPNIKETCTAKPCPTPPPADPDCKDLSRSCKVVVQARLCKIGYYNRMCCRSCIGH